MVGLAVELPVPSRLDGLAVGSTARVADVHGGDATSLRLLEMGLTPGATVRVVGRAPLGDPLELEIRGYRLSIRHAEAARVTLADCGTSLPAQDATNADRGNPRRFHRSAKWKKAMDGFFHGQLGPRT